jgi:starch synthase
MKILFATPECAPYVKTGGLGEVSAALPATLARLGHDVRLLMPAYSGMRVSGEVLDTIDIAPYGPFPAAQLLPVRVANGVTLLLLACPALYQRNGGPYVDSAGHDHHDNALRFGFLSRVAALLGTGASPCRDWRADIVHANDWPCGFAPLYLAQARLGERAAAASVMTIHNIAFQGMFPMYVADLLGVPHHWRGIDGVEFWGQVSMLKAGLQFADAITTVSPTYAREIQTEAFGVGLQGVLQARAQRLFGILNGIDTEVWNPLGDPLIPASYGAANLAAKAENKVALQRRCGLAADPKAMVFGVVSRLTSQKGIDLVLRHLDQLRKGGGQLAVLGQGEPALHDALATAAQAHAGTVAVSFGYDETLAHLIEAGADCFLMPSRFEPCGMNQMYSQRYGTPPVVNATGGLVDTVVDAGTEAPDATGFLIPEPSVTSLVVGVRRAIAAYRDPVRWRRMQVQGMTRDFGWGAAARAYIRIFDALRPTS